VASNLNKSKHTYYIIKHVIYVIHYIDIHVEYLIQCHTRNKLLRHTHRILITIVITYIAAFLPSTVYEGVTNRHAIESMHVYTRC